MATSTVPFQLRIALTFTLLACGSGAPQHVSHAGEQGQPPSAQPAESSLAAGDQPSGSAAAAPPSPSSTAAPTPSSTAAEPEVVEAAAAHEGLPTECYTQGALCLPAPNFVDRLCRAANVGTAIRLFAKGSPFTRAYVRMREVRALNLRGGPSGDTPLTFAEEVLLLAQHGTSGDFQVSGDGGYDVLRWDGTCATLSSDEIVTRVPAPPRHAPFPWKYLDDGVQAALLQNPAVRSALDAERKRCHGSSDSERSAACRDAVEQLNDRVFVAIRSGIALPVAEYSP